MEVNKEERDTTCDHRRRGSCLRLREASNFMILTTMSGRGAVGQGQQENHRCIRWPPKRRNFWKDIFPKMVGSSNCLSQGYLTLAGCWLGCETKIWRWWSSRCSTWQIASVQLQISWAGPFSWSPSWWKDGARRYTRPFYRKAGYRFSQQTTIRRCMTFTTKAKIGAGACLTTCKIEEATGGQEGSRRQLRARMRLEKFKAGKSIGRPEERLEGR